MWTLWPVVLARANFILHSVGWLDGGLTVSYEKFIMDADMLAMFYHFFQGFEINTDTLALDMIDLVGPGGHHFDTPHTQSRYTHAFFESALADRQSFDTWVAMGAQDIVQRANAVWKDLLASYEAPALDPGIEQALREFVERRSKGAGADQSIRMNPHRVIKPMAARQANTPTHWPGDIFSFRSMLASITVEAG